VVSGIAQALRDALRSLPGIDAQLRMAPTPRVGWDPYSVPPGVRHAAALLLIYPGEEGLSVPLTVRGSALRKHTGQVSLPGGSVDEGESIEVAALRETAEEIGAAPAAVEILGRLTPLHIPVSGFLLHAVVGVTPARPAFRPAEWEVARLLEVPLDRLRDPGIIGRETRTRERPGGPIQVEVPYFSVDGEKVWGATAMVLAEFLEVLRRL
jgi:8-oxo-dGTP pyrophosphatase MutT (NUDIX family)